MLHDGREGRGLTAETAEGSLWWTYPKMQVKLRWRYEWAAGKEDRGGDARSKHHTGMSKRLVKNSSPPPKPSLCFYLLFLLGFHRGTVVRLLEEEFLHLAILKIVQFSDCILCSLDQVY